MEILKIKEWIYSTANAQFEVRGYDGREIDSVLRFSDRLIFCRDVEYEIPGDKRAGFSKVSIVFKKFYNDLIHIDYYSKFYNHDNISTQSVIYSEINNITSDINTHSE